MTRRDRLKRITQRTLRPKWLTVRSNLGDGWSWLNRHRLGVFSVAALIIGLWLYRVASPNDFDERLRTLTAIATGIGAFGLFINLLFTSETVENSRQTLLDQRESRFTDRYYESIKQLGHENGGVRLGALYALESLFHDSLMDQEAILEVVAAFIRSAGSKERTSQWTSTPRDLEQALIVLGELLRTKPREPNFPGSALFYLSNLDLSHVDVVRGCFVGIDFSYSDLQVSRLRLCNFRHAYFVYSDLSNAWLSSSNFEHADLTGADLRGAYLGSALNLTWKQLEVAKLDRSTRLPADLLANRPEWYDTLIVNGDSEAEES